MQATRQLFMLLQGGAEGRETGARVTKMLQVRLLPAIRAFATILPHCQAHSHEAAQDVLVPGLPQQNTHTLPSFCPQAQGPARVADLLGALVARDAKARLALLSEPEVSRRLELVSGGSRGIS